MTKYTQSLNTCNELTKSCTVKCEESFSVATFEDQTVKLTEEQCEYHLKEILKFFHLDPKTQYSLLTDLKFSKILPKSGHRIRRKRRTVQTLTVR